MLKKRLFLLWMLSLVALLVIVPVAVNAQSELRGTLDRRGGINILRGPGNQWTVLAGVANGYRFRILGRNADSSWLQVVTPNGRYSGWVPAVEVINLTGSIASLPQTADTGVWSALVGTGALNIRSGPSPDFDTLLTVPSGTTMDILGRNEAASWVKIKVPRSNLTGWVSTRYIYTSVRIGTLPVVAN